MESKMIGRQDEPPVVMSAMPAVAPSSSPALVAVRAELDNAARELAHGAQSAHTLEAYDRRDGT